MKPQKNYNYIHIDQYRDEISDYVPGMIRECHNKGKLRLANSKLVQDKLNDKNYLNLTYGIKKLDYRNNFKKNLEAQNRLIEHTKTANPTLGKSCSENANSLPIINEESSNNISLLSHKIFGSGAPMKKWNIRNKKQNRETFFSYNSSHSLNKTSHKFNNQIVSSSTLYATDLDRATIISKETKEDEIKTLYLNSKTSLLSKAFLSDYSKGVTRYSIEVERVIDKLKIKSTQKDQNEKLGSKNNVQYRSIDFEDNSFKVNHFISMKIKPANNHQRPTMRKSKVFEIKPINMFDHISSFLNKTLDYKDQFNHLLYSQKSNAFSSNVFENFLMDYIQKKRDRKRDNIERTEERLLTSEENNQYKITTKKIVLSGRNFHRNESFNTTVGVSPALNQVNAKTQTPTTNYNIKLTLVELIDVFSASLENSDTSCNGLYSFSRVYKEDEKEFLKMKISQAMASFIKKLKFQLECNSEQLEDESSHQQSYLSNISNHNRHIVVTEDPTAQILKNLKVEVKYTENKGKVQSLSKIIVKEKERKTILNTKELDNPNRIVKCLFSNYEKEDIIKLVQKYSATKLTENSALKHNIETLVSLVDKHSKMSASDIFEKLLELYKSAVFKPLKPSKKLIEALNSPSSESNEIDTMRKTFMKRKSLIIEELKVLQKAGGRQQKKLIKELNRKIKEIEEEELNKLKEINQNTKKKMLKKKVEYKHSSIEKKKQISKTKLDKSKLKEAKESELRLRKESVKLMKSKASKADVTQSNSQRESLTPDSNSGGQSSSPKHKKSKRDKKISYLMHNLSKINEHESLNDFSHKSSISDSAEGTVKYFNPKRLMETVFSQIKIDGMLNCNLMRNTIEVSKYQRRKAYIAMEHYLINSTSRRNSELFRKNSINSRKDSQTLQGLKHTFFRKETSGSITKHLSGLLRSKSLVIDIDPDNRRSKSCMLFSFHFRDKNIAYLNKNLFDFYYSENQNYWEMNLHAKQKIYLRYARQSYMSKLKSKEDYYLRRFSLSPNKKQKKQLPRGTMPSGKLKENLLKVQTELNQELNQNRKSKKNTLMQPMEEATQKKLGSIFRLNAKPVTRIRGSEDKVELIKKEDDNDIFKNIKLIDEETGKIDTEKYFEQLRIAQEEKMKEKIEKLISERKSATSVTQSNAHLLKQLNKVPDDITKFTNQKLAYLQRMSSRGSSSNSKLESSGSLIDPFARIASLNAKRSVLNASSNKKMVKIIEDKSTKLRISEKQNINGFYFCEEEIESKPIDTVSEFKLGSSRKDLKTVSSLDLIDFGQKITTLEQDLAYFASKSDYMNEDEIERFNEINGLLKNLQRYNQDNIDKITQ